MNEYAERVENYLLGIMSPEERLVFEEELKSNSELSASLDEARDLMVGIEDHFDNELKSKLRHIEGPDNKAKVVYLKKRRNLRWSLVAAIAVLLIIATFYLIPGDQPSELYAQYYSDYPNIIELQQRAESSPISTAFLFYQQGNWNAADKSFQTLISSDQSLIYPHFYRAISRLNLNDPSEAINELETVIRSNDERFLQPAKWYLALAHLRKGDTAASKTILGEIASTEGNYATEAAALVNELE